MIEPLIIKHLDGSHWSWSGAGSGRLLRVEGKKAGYYSRVHLHQVDRPIIVSMNGRDACVFHDDCVYDMYLPDHQAWCVSIFHDQTGRLIQWYFDIIGQRGIAENGWPYFQDLYLDVAFCPGHVPRILDDDELIAARDKGWISSDAVDEARLTAKRIVQDIIPEWKAWEACFTRCQQMLSENEFPRIERDWKRSTLF